MLQMENAATTYIARDRGALIIALSVGAILILGPITGVPAWIMANQDLRDLHAGYLPPSALGSLNLGRILAIIGTFFSPLWLLAICTLLFIAVMVIGEVSMAMF
jgi:hypothetical protein